MHLVYGDDANVAQWVAERIPQMVDGGDFGPCTALGVVTERGVAIGGVVFHNYQARFRSIECSFAATTPRWLTRNLLKQILGYPFGQLDCQRITAVTPRKAASARRFLDTFGFKREGLVRRGFGTDDAVISGLLKSEWLRSRWAAPSNPREGSNGQVSADAAASTRPDGDCGRAVGGEPAIGDHPEPAE